MLEFLKTSFWFTVSVKMGLSIELSKNLLENLNKRLLSGDLNVNSLSPHIKDSLEFYLVSKDYLTDL